MTTSLDFDLRYIFLPEDTVPELPCVYAILNTWTSELYIGSTNSFRSRKTTHLTRLRNRKLSAIAIQAGWDRSPDQFVFIIISVIKDKEERLNQEQYYLDKFNPVLNNHINSRSKLGVKATEVTKQKLRASLKGRVVSESTRNKISEANIGRVLSPIQRKKTSDGLLKAYAEGRKSVPTRPVIQLTLDGVFVKEWPGLTEAANSLGTWPSNICNCIKWQRKSCVNYTWKYK